MKKTLLLGTLLLCISAVFTSCGNDEDDNAAPNATTGTTNNTNSSDNNSNATGDSGSSSTPVGVLVVNGKTWEPAGEDAPKFKGYSATSGDYFCIIAVFHQDVPDDGLYYEGEVSIRLTTGSATTPLALNTDLTKSLRWDYSTSYACSISYSACEDMNDLDTEIEEGAYDNVISGSVTITELKVGEYVTIKYDNLKIGRTSSTQLYSAPETLTINGVITYSYTTGII